MTIAVVQLGARMHYAVPRLFHEAGVLETLFTDLCSNAGWQQALGLVPSNCQPTAVRKLLERVPHGIPASKIVHHTILGLRYALQLRYNLTGEQLAVAHIQAGKQLADRAIRHGFGNANAVYAFNSAALDVLRAARARGLTAICEQTSSPVAIEWELMRDEFKEWKGWERQPDIEGFYHAFEDLQFQEWASADVIVCGSEFVKAGMQQVGGPSRITRVVPYGVAKEVGDIAEREPPRRRRLRVLTVGNIRLLKGAPYVALAARELSSVAEFRWVGPNSLNDLGMSVLRRHIELVGPVARSELAAHYAWADVFLLPSICEGSAVVTYEAIQHGLPLIVTHNTGAPLPADSASFIPIRDPQAIVTAITRLISNPEECQRQAIISRKTADELTVSAYGQRLLAAIACT